MTNENNFWLSDNVSDYSALYLVVTNIVLRKLLIGDYDLRNLFLLIKLSSVG